MSEKVFGRTSKKYTHYAEYKDLYKKYKIDKIKDNKNHYIYTILDSSLITQTPYQKYNIKLIECGYYIYLYDFGKTKMKKVKEIKKFYDKRKDIKLELKKLDLRLNEFNEEKKEKIKKVKLKEIKLNENNENNKIELKNINRSKYSLQMLIKTNEDIFKTFITLTFRDEITDIQEANKKFNIFKTSIKRAYKDFSYISVPEYQKNGRIHYHLLTNIEYDNLNLINENISFCNLLSKFSTHNYKLCSLSSFKDKDQKFFFQKDEYCSKNFNLSQGNTTIILNKSWYELIKTISRPKFKVGRSTNFEVKNLARANFDRRLTFTNLKQTKLNDFPICLRYVDNKLQNTKKTFNKKSSSNKVFKTLKYWTYGYSNVVSISNINIVGYLTKYLTKDIDNRLFSFRRYTYSLNLKKPSITYLNLERLRDFYRFFNSTVNLTQIYNYQYSTIYDENINFTELKLVD